MRLFFTNDSIAVAVAIVLEEAGRAYDPVFVDFSKSEQTKPGFLAVNPKGRVPALEVDGQILTETGAILEFLAALAPGIELVPSDPLNAARMREVMFYCATTFHVNHAHKMRGHRWADREESWSDMTAKVPQTMTASAAYIEATSLMGPLVLGDRLSLADPYLFICCSWLGNDQVDLAPFPKVRAFLEAMNARASVTAIRDKGILTL